MFLLGLCFPVPARTSVGGHREGSGEISGIDWGKRGTQLGVAAKGAGLSPGQNWDGTRHAWFFGGGL